MLALTSSIKTPYHAWPAATKLFAAAVGVSSIQFLEEPVATAAAAGIVGVAYLTAGKLFFLEGLRLLRPIWMFVVVPVVWHTAEGNPHTGVAVAFRIVAAVSLANLVTMTTRLDDLLDVVLRLLAPLRRVGIDPAPIGFSVALVIRFTPVLLGKASALFEAWRARSHRRVGWRVIIPLGIAAFDDADRIAEAIRARGGINARARVGSANRRQHLDT